MHRLLGATAIGVFVLIAACAQLPDEEEATAPTEEPAATMQQCTDKEPESAEKSDEGVGEEKPEFEIPEGAPPCELVIDDIHKGDGKKAPEGGTVTVHYVGKSWSTGEEFDASWDGGQPATFPLGQVIPGWQEGIPGMREGGRRRLIIPPDLAYGPQGQQGIAPNETLVFVVDLIDVAK